MHRDVYADARAMEGRLGCGRGVNAVFRELIRRENAGVVAAILAGQRLERIEEIVTKILLLQEDKNSGGGPPPTMTVS